MITLPVFFSLILVILPAPTKQDTPTIVYYSKESKIDWSKCKTDFKCFCTDGITNELKERSLEMRKATDNDPASTMCNIGVRIQFFDEDIALFQLQVLGSSNNIHEDQELMLYKESEKVFGCKFNKTSKEAILDVNPELLKNQISLFEDWSSLKSGNVHCAVLIKSHKNFINSIEKRRSPFSNKKTIMKLRSVEYIHEPASNDFFQSQVSKIRCNAYSFKDLLVSQQYYVQPITNRDEDLLNCQKYGSRYRMRYDKGNETGIEMEGLECVEDTINSGFSYNIHKYTVDTHGVQTVSVETFTDPETYNIYCAAEINEVCTNPIDCKPETDPTCPVYKEGIKGQAATLECADFKWMIDNQYVVMSANNAPVCMRSKYSMKNEATFLFNGKKELRQNARCFTKYDCKLKSKLILPVCGDDKALCGLIDASDPSILKCEDPTKQLTIYYSRDQNLTLTNSSYMCNPSSGLYYNETTIVPARSRVRCIGENKPVVLGKVQFSNDQIIGIIAGCTVVFLIVIAAIVLAIYFVSKSPKKIRKNMKKNWITIKRSEKIERCREDFGRVLRATAVNAVHLLVGLDLVELLLDTETEEPECWEEVYKFLKRLQGALKNIDHGLKHLFARYMYLEAKKIIDKHGWLTDTPITKNNQKGLIRTVAIRLLSFALHDPKTPEANELLGYGYSKLGFRAVKQYPHCGVMWSVIMHARQGWFKRKTGPNMRVFRVPAFVDKLMKVAGHAKIVMPKEDAIPAFGTLEEQAAFAIGGSPYFYFHADEGLKMGKKLLLEVNNSNEGAVPLSYFKGMAEAVSYFSIQMIMDVFQFWPKANPQLLKDIMKSVPEAAWNDVVQAAMKKLTYYGFNFDAQRLQARFNQSAEEYDKLEEEQKCFAEAVEAAKEKMRNWFAKRTDKDELKKKPKYNTNSKIKLDSRVATGNSATGVDGASATKSKSDTKSNNQSSGGGSNKSDNAPAPAPSDPNIAATPAAAATPEAAATPKAAATPVAPEAAAAPAATPTPNAAAATPATP